MDPLALQVATRYLEAAAAPLELLDFARITKPGIKEEVFLVLREGTYYVLTYSYGGNLSFGIQSNTNSEGQAKSHFDRITHKLVKGVQEQSQWAGEVTESTPDAEALKHLKVFDHPLFGVDWNKSVELEDPEKDFLRYLQKHLESWKGSPGALSSTDHEYWPTFQAMVQKAIQRKYGDNIVLYRGIHGDQAKELLEKPGTPVKLHKYSSWTVSQNAAKSYRGVKDHWVIIKAMFDPRDVALAPVKLPEFIEPDILRKLAFDVAHVGDELIVGPMTSLSHYSIVLRSKKPL